MIAMAQAAAAAHKLPPEVVCAIAERESTWNPWSIRYEPAFFNKYVIPLYTKALSNPKPEDQMSITEAKARSFSWGLMQLMGEDARELGFTGDLASLCDPETGLEYGCVAFARKLAVNGGDVGRALEAYNGGANPNYAAEVMTIAPQFEPKSA